ncbi:unnamed protein product [Hydatigera taeniaeformis]|uniref:DUF4808 domain-containing protein n=1 Tax=Hydatigena taeniaeformis TaxID=6205 RepID=A0A0R3XCT7_HYDTA|nr:unnamed protein product [Hydatigera taeniaeformis]
MLRFANGCAFIILAKDRESVADGDETYLSSSRVESYYPHEGNAEPVQEEESRPAIILQPLHIAIGVCLIILMAVGVLLHVVIVLYRRHCRLKRELMRQTQKTTATDSQQLQQQQPDRQPFTSANATAGQMDGQQIHLQQLKYSTASPEQLCQYVSDKPNRRSCCFLCVWKRPQVKTLPSNAYSEAPTQTTNMISEMQFKQCLMHKPHTSSQPLIAYHGLPATVNSPSNSVPSASTLPNSSILSQQQQHQQLSSLQPVMCSPHSPDHALHPSINKNAYATGSSVSGGSGNNPSTAESSLPTQSSAVTGWNNVNNNVFVLNGLTHTTNVERPNPPDNIEIGDPATPDFETRRANVALPPALLGVEGVVPPVPSPPVNSTSLALFRSAASQNEASTLVTPYAQLQLSLSFDQYDTPERIFTDGNTPTAGSGSLDGFNGPRNQLSSNPTTNSSLLHSYCEHGGTGDLRV